MQIICPECQFAREVDETKIPAKSQVATCPKCKTKFRFRDLPEDEAPVAETPVTEAPSEEVSVSPAPTEEQPKAPVGQTQATLPIQDEPASDFPTLRAPGEDPKEELWDKLGDMTPPEDTPQSTAPKTPEPPVIQQPTPPVETQEVEQEPVPGWTGEFNSDFPDPMQDEKVEEEEESSMQVPPPFEQLDRYGFFYGMFMTIKLLLTSPRLFFAVMPVGGGLAKPLTFAILAAMIQAFTQLAWGAAGLTVGLDIVNDQITAVPYNTSEGIFDLLFTPATVAFTAFLFAGFYHLLFILLRSDKQGYEGTFRAVTYGFIPIITGIFPMPSLEILSGWLLVYAIWSLVLTAIGLKHIHKTSYLKVIPIVIMPILVFMILMLSMMQSQLAAI